MKKDLERYRDRMTQDEERRVWAKMKEELRGERRRGWIWAPRPWLPRVAVAAAAVLAAAVIWHGDLLDPDKALKMERKTAPLVTEGIAPSAEKTEAREPARSTASDAGRLAEEEEAAREKKLADRGHEPEAPLGAKGATPGEQAAEGPAPERTGGREAADELPAGRESAERPQGRAEPAPQAVAPRPAAAAQEEATAEQEPLERALPELSGGTISTQDAAETGAVGVRASSGGERGVAAKVPPEKRVHAQQLSAAPAGSLGAPRIAAMSGAPDTASSSAKPTEPAAAARAREEERGHIKGRVTDSSGDPVADAKVTVEGTRFGALTDENGAFIIRNLSPGKYALKITAEGYEEYLIGEVRVEKGKVHEIEKIVVRPRATDRADTTGAQPAGTNQPQQGASKQRGPQQQPKGPAERHPGPVTQQPQGSQPPALGTLTIDTKAGRPASSEALREEKARRLAGGSARTPLASGACPVQPRGRRHYPSLTGGRRPVNDGLADDMFFRHYGTNPFVDADEDALSTFALDVDTGSYTICRRYIQEGALPPPEAARVEEFVNFFAKDFPPPRRGDFAIYVDGMPSPFAHVQDGSYRLLRVGIRGRAIDDTRRAPAQIVLVIDTSGSMGMGNRLPLLKRSLEILLDELRADDEIGIVEFGTRARVVLPLTPLCEDREIYRAIRRLYPSGSTNAEHGLRLGYEMLRRSAREGWIHRIIFCSDGVANVGNTGWERILESVRRESDEISLTTIGFGMGNYNDVLMERLADAGDGRYAYVDDLSEAKRVLREGLTGTLQTIAKDVKAQIEFDPERVAKYRLLGYENRDLRDEDFRNDDVDAGEIGAGHEVTVLYEVKLEERARRGRIATVRLRYERPDDRGSLEPAQRWRRRRGTPAGIVEIEKSIRTGDLYRSVEDAPADLALDACVAEFAEILRESYWAKDGSLEEVLFLLEETADRMTSRPEIDELIRLVARAAWLKGEPQAERTEPLGR